MSSQHADAFPASSRSSSRSPAAAATSTSTTRRPGVFRLDRVLSSAVFYNFDYGFIEGTRADDGDHTDALLIIDEPTFTGCHVWARRSAASRCATRRASTSRSCASRWAIPHQQHIERLEQVRPHRLVEIEHFFETYKMLEDKAVDVLGWRDRDRALEVLRRGPGALSHRARWLTALVRLFIAVAVPPDALAACQAALLDPVRAGPRGGGVRWVRTENLHLTLRFLGDTEPERHPGPGDRGDGAAAAVSAVRGGAWPAPARSRTGAIRGRCGSSVAPAELEELRRSTMALVPPRPHGLAVRRPAVPART